MYQQPLPCIERYIGISNFEILSRRESMVDTMALIGTFSLWIFRSLVSLYLLTIHQKIPKISVGM